MWYFSWENLVPLEIEDFLNFLNMRFFTLKGVISSFFGALFQYNLILEIIHGMRPIIIIIIVIAAQNRSGEMTILGHIFHVYTVNTQKVFNRCIRNLWIPWYGYTSLQISNFRPLYLFFMALAGLDMIAWTTNFENYPPFYCPIIQKVLKLCMWYFHIPRRGCMWLFISDPYVL